MTDSREDKPRRERISDAIQWMAFLAGHRERVPSKRQLEEWADLIRELNAAPSSCAPSVNIDALVAAAISTDEAAEGTFLFNRGNPKALRWQIAEMMARASVPVPECADTITPARLEGWLRSWWTSNDGYRAEMRAAYGIGLAHLMRGVADMIDGADKINAAGPERPETGSAVVGQTPPAPAAPDAGPVSRYIALYREHCGGTPLLNNQEIEVINRLVNEAPRKEPSAEGPTPRVAALLATWPSTMDTEGDAAKMQAMVTLARQLERELAEARTLVKVHEAFDAAPVSARPALDYQDAAAEAISSIADHHDETTEALLIIDVRKAIEKAVQDALSASAAP